MNSAENTVPPFPTDIRIGIDPPPDHIFKYRRNRMAPAQQVWGVQGTVSYVPINARYIPNEGNFVDYYKVPFPSKTVAPVEAIYAMAPAKRLTVTVLNFIATLHKKGRMTRLCKIFNDVALMTMMNWLLLDEYYCKPAKEVRKFVSVFLTSLGVEKSVADETAEIVACFVEYDNAYRFRLQDIGGEVNTKELIKNFPKEIERLISILASRETVEGGGQAVVQRFKNAAIVLKWAWRLPPLRKRIRKALNAMDFNSVKMDEADQYHSLLYGDYNAKGLSMEQKITVLEALHGKDYTLWPPRMLIKNSANG